MIHIDSAIAFPSAIQALVTLPQESPMYLNDEQLNRAAQ